MIEGSAARAQAHAQARDQAHVWQACACGRAWEPTRPHAQLRAQARV